MVPKYLTDIFGNAEISPESALRNAEIRYALSLRYVTQTSGDMGASVTQT